MSGPSLRYVAAPGAAPVVVEFPDGTDPFEVLAKIFERFGGGKPDVERDRRFDEVIARRRGSAVEAEVGKQTAGSAPAVDLIEDAPVAQLAERGARNSEVPGSIPGGGSKPVGVRDTSMAAYRGLEWSGKLGKQQQIVVDFFVANPGRWTRQEIARGTGLSINATCGRVNELLAEPFAILEEGDEKKDCSITKNRVNALALRRNV